MLVLSFRREDKNKTVCVSRRKTGSCSRSENGERRMKKRSAGLAASIFIALMTCSLAALADTVPSIPGQMYPWPEGDHLQFGDPRVGGGPFLSTQEAADFHLAALGGPGLYILCPASIGLGVSEATTSYWICISNLTESFAFGTRRACDPGYQMNNGICVSIGPSCPDGCAHRA